MLQEGALLSASANTHTHTHTEAVKFLWTAAEFCVCLCFCNMCLLAQSCMSSLCRVGFLFYLSCQVHLPEHPAEDPFCLSGCSLQTCSFVSSTSNIKIQSDKRNLINHFHLLSVFFRHRCSDQIRQTSLCKHLSCQNHTDKSTFDAM